MSTPQQHPLIGQVIAERYRVLELLAEGGMGAVYIAEHLTLHKDVALKVVHPEHAGNEELIARFAREAMATSRIDHPNVISAMDFGTLPDGTAYLAVQLVRGPSLTRVLKAEKRMHWARASLLGAQIADALNEAHGHGIIHRDLKPDNVLLQFRDDGSEVVKVLDFGVAKFGPESKVPLSARTDVTQVGMVVGTPGYMAPEQTIGNPADERSDLYALGVILWEAIVGRPLWSAHDLQGLVERQMSETPAPLRAASGDMTIPDELEALVIALLARRAEERPNSAIMVRDALREHGAHATIDADRPRWRTGARPVPRAPKSDELTIPFPSLATADTTPAPARADATAPVLDYEVVQPATASSAGKPRKISVPPPPLPSLSPPAKSSSGRLVWILSTLLVAIVGGAAALISTGYLELHPPDSITRDMGPTPGERAAAEVEATHAEPTRAKSPPQKVVGARDPAADAREQAEPKEQARAPSEATDKTVAKKGVTSPLFTQYVAKLNRYKTCDGKRAMIEALGELGDPRAVAVLKKIASRPRTGCGKKRREDCFGCLRKPLEQALEKLRASTK